MIGEKRGPSSENVLRDAELGYLCGFDQIPDRRDWPLENTMGAASYG